MTLKLSLTSIQMLRLMVLFLRRKPNFLSSSLDIWMVMVKIALRMVMRVIQMASVMTMPITILYMKMTMSMTVTIHKINFKIHSLCQIGRAHVLNSSH